jgi:hypothetical protein
MHDIQITRVVTAFKLCLISVTMCFGCFSSVSNFESILDSRALIFETRALSFESRSLVCKTNLESGALICLVMLLSRLVWELLILVSIELLMTIQIGAR